MTIISDLSDLEISQVSVTNYVMITARVASPTAPCPCCGTVSKRVHSHYQRTLRDLSASGRPVHLVMQVRRFFCEDSTCRRKIFAERFPSLTLPRVKFTRRLQEALREMGFEPGGEAGARLGKKLNYPGSPDTILRLVKQNQLPTTSSPRVVGIDDWGWKRGLRYGTLICNLENNRPIDVLPDRSVQTVSAWFEKRPSVEIVSRDRSSEYAAAISKGAPQALQVADLWHIGKNLSKRVQTLLARGLAEIRRGLRIQATPEQEPEETEPMLEEERRPARSHSVKLAQEGRRAQKLDRYEQVVEMHQQGVKAAEIASRVGIGERTVHRWLAHGSFPEARQRRRRPSLIDPYERYVLKWWQEGHRNVVRLHQELVAQGCKGSYASVRDHFVRRLPEGKKNSAKGNELSPAPLPSRQATFLFLARAEQLDGEEQETVRQLRQSHPEVDLAYDLVQEFAQMLRTRTGEDLDDWLAKALASQIPEFRSFVQGIERDKDAVKAVLTLPTSNGIVEGKVHKLKLVKRMGYGRAGFALLRQRVLHAL